MEGERPDLRSLGAAQRALLAKRVRDSGTARALAAEPIAIVGIACRFPGAPDPEAYWRLLHEGRDAVREIPADRWDVDGYYDPDPRAAGKICTRAGGFLDALDRFQPEFFGISPREAVCMDPQQRMLLEVGWEALEDAGQTREGLAGSRTGVFVGVSGSEYTWLQIGDPEAIDAYTVSGAALSIFSGRLSFWLDLRGPSISVDTACSSSLVAVHLASKSLRTGESDLALAAGVNVVLTPQVSIGFSRWGVLSAQGCCRTFDAAADGIVRSEGCGAVVLKRLSDAIADGDPVWGLIRGSAVNQDGRSAGLTAPNLQAQTAVLREALDDAGVAPERIRFVEAHGTGTRLGDPIEVEALTDVLGGGGAAGRPPCALGAVKTNLGHLEAAAGVAGLIKAVLVLRHREVPPNLHFEELNPNIRLEGTPFVLPAEPHRLDGGEGPLFGGVSSFGFSGTNAHVVLEEAPAAATASAPDAPHHGEALPLVLSAAHPDTLRDEAETLADHLLGLGDAAQPALPAVCAALATRRTPLDHRRSLVVHSAAEAEQKLRALAGDAADRGREVLPPGRRQVAFAFSGQGSQWAEMGRALADRFGPFRSALDDARKAIADACGRDVTRDLWTPAGQSTLDRTEVAQPAIFALQVALARQWMAWGIRPGVVLGHSLGEIAAAHVAGALSLEEAARIVCERGRLMDRATGRGAMVAVALPAAELEPLVQPESGRVSIAVLNSPTSTVIAGEPGAVERVVEAVAARGVEHRGVSDRYAFHTAQMEDAAAALREALPDLRPQRGEIRMISTVEAREIDPATLDADYWARNVREPVDFSGAVGALSELEVGAVVELGPHPVLTRPLRECFAGADAPAALHSLRRGRPEVEEMLQSLGQLHELGIRVDWETVYPPAPPVRLPRRHWKRGSYWIAREPRRPTAPRGGDTALHPLMQRRMDLPDGGRAQVWEADLVADSPRFLGQHRVGSERVAPAAAVVEMALYAAAQVSSEPDVAVDDLRLERMLLLRDGEPVRVQAVVTREPDGRSRFELFSRADAAPGSAAAWRRHACAVLGPVAQAQATADAETPPVPTRECVAELSRDEHYERMAALGLGYGPAFRGVSSVALAPGEAVAQLEAPEGVDWGDESFALHPTLLDACLQVLAAAALHTLPGQEESLPLPVGFARVRALGPAGAGPLECRARIRPAPDGGWRGDVVLRAADGAPVLEVRGVEARPTSLIEAIPEERWFYRGAWLPLDGIGAPAAGAEGDWLVLAGPGPLAAGLVESLAARGHACTCIQVSADGRVLDDGALDRALARVRDPGESLRGVVHAATVDAPTDDGGAGALELGCHVTLRLVDALGERGAGGPALWLVTRAAQPTGDKEEPPVGPMAAPLWGLGRTLRHERPELRCAMVDLPAGEPPDESEALAELVCAQCTEDELALRGSEWLVHRVVRSPAPDEVGAAPAIRADATYLVAGGTGGLGTEVARWLLDRGARSLALLARGDHPVPQRLYDHPDAERAVVRVFRADLADAERVAVVMEEIARELPPLRGVFHAAGTLDDAVLTELDRERLARVCAPKVGGAWSLHEHTRALDLDFFAMFSSAASLLGSPGQGSYAAANAFLDALAHHRRALGLPALAINWGAWSEVGMAAAPELARRLARQGLGALKTDQALRILERLLAGDAPQVGVVPMDLGRWLRRFPSARGMSLISELVAEIGEDPEVGASARDHILGADDPRAGVVEYLRERIARAMELPLGEVNLDASQSLTELGLDSLMAMEIKDRAELELGVPLTLAELLRAPSLAALGETVLGKLEAESGDAAEWEEISL